MGDVVLEGWMVVDVRLVGGVGVFVSTFVLGKLLLRRISLSSHMTHELLRCCAAGVLIGLGILVLLPESMEDSCSQKLDSHYVFLTFMGTICVMFLLENVLLPHEHHEHHEHKDHEHNHGHHHGHNHHHSHNHSANCSHKKISDRASLVADGSSHDDEDTCDQDSLLGSSSPPPRTSLRHKIVKWIDMACRLFPWIVHAVLDGSMIGLETRSAVTVISAVVLCALQDTIAFVIFIEHTTTSTTHDDKQLNSKRTLMLFVFSLAFLVGTGLGMVLTDEQINASEFLWVSRTIMAGIFVYIACFEMLPSHCDNRWQNMKRILCFVLALMSSFSIEMFGG
eukprot:c4161_g1_i1.p1 GENE.c4161_g1_i1~~c4161_g1_i1.p1  ORF type:complete len:337 (-),score=49.89 c4161_g1_i1:767-1777(-)